MVVLAAFGLLAAAALIGALVVRATDSEGAPGTPATESVAFDGTNFFVAWQDGRRGGIYGARVSQSGAVLDRTAIPISTGGGEEGNPRVAFDGTNYLVVWTDTRSDSFPAETDVYGARVSRTGKVLDQTGIPIATGANYQEVGGVTHDGTNFLVVWDVRDDYTIRGARVDEAGNLLDPKGIVISKGAEEKHSPSVAFGGTTYLVAWTGWRRGGPKWKWNIYGARVSKAGEVLDPAGVAISSSDKAEVQSIAVGDHEYLVTWTHGDELDQDIRGVRVSQEGTVLDSDELVIGKSSAGAQQWMSSAAFDGANYLVAWENARSYGYDGDVYGAPVSRTGEVSDPAGTVIWRARGAQELPSIGFGGSSFLVTWEESSEIFGVRVDKTGTAIDPIPIPISTAR